jgi:lysozyme
MSINIDSKCIDLIKSFEGLSLKAYHDSIDKIGVDTIGYGSILYPDGTKVKVGDPDITEQKACELLEWEVRSKLQEIDLYTRDDLTTNQFNAIVSFCYNLGVGAYKGSTLRQKINSNPTDPTIRQEFLKWDMSAGQHIKGLARRRQSEADLYFTK